MFFPTRFSRNPAPRKNNGIVDARGVWFGRPFSSSFSSNMALRCASARTRHRGRDVAGTHAAGAAAGGGGVGPKLSCAMPAGGTQSPP